MMGRIRALTGLTLVLVALTLFRPGISHAQTVEPLVYRRIFAPSDALDPVAGLRPVLRLTSAVSFVKRVPAGAHLSYGLRYEVVADSTIVTVPGGYADGVPRRLGEVGGEVLIGGARYPIAGTVTMDQLLVDVGDAEFDPNDAVRPPLGHLDLIEVGRLVVVDRRPRERSFVDGLGTDADDDASPLEGVRDGRLDPVALVRLLALPSHVGFDDPPKLAASATTDKELLANDKMIFKTKANRPVPMMMDSKRPTRGDGIQSELAFLKA